MKSSSVMAGMLGIALLSAGCAEANQGMVKTPAAPIIKATGAEDKDTADKDTDATEAPKPMVDARPPGASTLELTQAECLSRIPPDASGGQRMLAEQACKQKRN